jgi:PTS system nitrogen regulatory IIA component
MNMKDALKESCVIADLKGGTKKEIITELATALKSSGEISNVEEAVAVILEREKLGSTGIGEGIAIPHGKMKGIDRILCAFGRSKKGVDFDAVDKKPVHIFFLLLAPEDSAGLHIQMLSRISRILRDPSFRKHLTEQGDDGGLYADIVREDEKFGG